MNRSFLSTACLCFALLVSGAPHAFASSVAKSIQDMDDESRAAVVRELVKSKSYTYGVTPKNRNAKGNGDTDALEDEDNVRDGAVKQGCNMDVANSKSEPGRASPRRTTVVITGPIVQLCNR